MIEQVEHGPTQWAREITHGAYDTHVHIAPDVMERRVTDLELARRFVELGLAGFVIKSHYVSTADRASVVSAAVPGCDAVGALCLNGSVGGLNPLAVEIAARLGARVVWMPTVDAANHRATAHDLPAGATPPMWLALQHQLADRGLEAPPVEVLDPEGRPLPALRAVCELIAEHGLVLGTGHLGRDEIFAVSEVALAAGVERLVVTHPEFPQQNLSLTDQQALARMGCFLERCWTTPFTGKYDWAQMVANIRATGPERTVVSSDLGQPHNPPVEDGLALMADALDQAGFSEPDIITMIRTNSRELVGDPVRAASTTTAT